MFLLEKYSIKIYDLHSRKFRGFGRTSPKKELSESILSDDTSWLKELNVNTFMDVIKLRKEAFSDDE